jgi:hypothetical protein
MSGKSDFKKEAHHPFLFNERSKGSLKSRTEKDKGNTVIRGNSDRELRLCSHVNICDPRF